jgi:hypothetical protein
LRNQKLECILQLGIDENSLSFFARFVLSLMAWLLKLTVVVRHSHQISSASERTTIPSIKLSHFGKMFHFGGQLQTDNSLPSNYVACSTHSSSQQSSTLVCRMLVSYFQHRGVSDDVADFTYVVAGTDADEIPERALGTVRLARTAIKSCSLPIRFLTDDESISKKYSQVSSNTRSVGGDAHLLIRILIADPIMAMLSAVSQIPLTMLWAVFPIRPNPSLPPHENPRKGPNNMVRNGTSADSTRPFEQGVSELIESLGDILVPVRKVQVSRTGSSLADDRGGVLVSSLDNVGPQEVDRFATDKGLVDIPLMQILCSDDIRRYVVAADYSLKAAAVRIVQSAAWRGLTFPIDTRMCRVELQSGQFFQQGSDRDGNPIFYFRNVCLGPWRGNEDAAIAAVLHRLEATLNLLVRDDPLVRFTLIVMMRRPEVMTTITVDKDFTGEKTYNSQEISRDQSFDETIVEDASFVREVPESNPRVYPGEKWHTHTNKGMLKRLIGIVTTHYPERLSKVLVVVGYGNATYMRTALRGKIALASAVQSKRTRDRVKFLKRYSDLQDYVERAVLVTIVGGESVISGSAFQFG